MSAVIITVIMWNDKQHNVVAKSYYHLKWPYTVDVVSRSKEIEKVVKFWFKAEAKTLRPRPGARGRGRGQGQIFGFEASLASQL